MELFFISSCKETELGGFPIWIIILGFVSHILLVLNSMVNLLIYCLVGTKFRKAFLKVPICNDLMIDTC